MDDFLDDLLRDSDDEDLPTAVKVPQPKLINTKIRLCSPNKNAVQSSCLGVVKHVKEDLKNVMSDPFFGIRFKSGVVDLSALEMLCKDIERVPLLSKVRPSQSTWLSVGVIVEKSVTLKSSNGNEYMIWKVHDLKNCDDKPLKMLLFGEAVKEHWKLQKGSVILIMSPQVMLDDKTSESIFKLSKSSSIIYIGSSVDLGKCKGKKQDGSECRAFVNEAKCEMCVYHAASEVRKLAARRGTFSQSILIPKKNGVVIKNNANLLSQSKFVDLTSIFNLHLLIPRPKIFASHSYISKNKEEMIKKEKETLNSIVNAKTTLSLGARCLASITTGSDVLQNISGDDAISFKQFLNSKHVDTERRVNGRTVKEEDAVVC
uniref:Mcm-10 n=1 Tax=Pristionchus pacificus TaxID=54126 RepID=A0A2A6BWC0_PRIPA|eukprot:PDM70204.1 mcm-10 [Pristionchus pacificus]